MKRGVAALAAGDPERALTEYKHAQELAPDANQPHRYAAEALVLLRRYAEACDSFERYLEINPNVSDADAVRARIGELRSRFLEGTVRVQCEPSGGDVFVDDGVTAVGKSPTDVPVTPGPHWVVVRLHGYRDARLEVNVPAGGRAEPTCALELLPPAPTEVSAKTEAHDAPPPNRAGSSTLVRTVGWTAVGLGVVALGTAAVFDAIIIPRGIDDFHTRAHAGDPSAGDAIHGLRTEQQLALAGYVAGGVLMLAGAAILLVASSPRTRLPSAVQSP
jgi:tetratricopeptide (TPR) repeat protein